MPYATDEDKKTVSKSIKKMLTQLIDECGDIGESSKIGNGSPKKMRLSGSFFKSHSYYQWKYTKFLVIKKFFLRS